MPRGTIRASVTTEILPVAGAAAVIVLVVVGIGLWAIGGDTEPGEVPTVEQSEPSELGSARATPRNPFPGPLAVGVEREEDTTHAECVQVADFYGFGDVEATGNLVVHNGEYIWTYPSWSCWVNEDGELFFTPIDTP